MQEYQNVISDVKPDAVTVDEYSVWTHTDIRRVSSGYVSTMRQYTKDEYIRLMDEQSQKTQADVAYIAMMTEVELE